MTTMKATVLRRTSSLADCDDPLELAELPEPGRGEILIRVSACGVCHTELDENLASFADQNLQCCVVRIPARFGSLIFSSQLISSESMRV